MPTVSTLIVFIAAALVLLLTPGPAVLYIVARSLDQGRTAGIVSAVGIGVGTLFHVVAAVVGLSALLVSSATAFSAVKYMGAAYLIYLGIRNFRERGEPAPVSLEDLGELRGVFYQGVVVNLLNPKVALFFLAFLPQFVDPGRGSVAIQILVLGLLLMLLGIISDSLYALLAGTLGNRLRNNAKFWRGQRYFSGSMYVGLGVLAAVSGSRNGG